MAGIRKYLILTFCSLLAGNLLYAQVISDPKELFEEGDFFFLAEEYEEALYLFISLLDSDPDNANFNFKVGNAYMNIPGQEYLAIPYLEKAILNTLAILSSEFSRSFFVTKPFVSSLTTLRNVDSSCFEVMSI